MFVQVPSRGLIEIKYSDAIGKARMLKNAAASLEKIRKTKLIGSTQTLAGAWKGDRADEYLAKTVNLDNELKELVKQINDAANAIERIAVNIKEADLIAYEVAMNRVY